jgi:hypothetical protein
MNSVVINGPSGCGRGVAIVPVLAVHGQQQSLPCVDITPHPDKTNHNIHRRLPASSFAAVAGRTTQSTAVSNEEMIAV